jgi:PAS domain S-box-containing protein
MNSATSTFVRQVEAMSDRLITLYQESYSQPSSNLLSQAMKELGIASERLQIAAKLIKQQQDQLSVTDQKIAAVNQRYHELLEFIPDAWLQTDEAGKILVTNRAASYLLNLPTAQLQDKPLSSFVTPDLRASFENDLKRLQQQPWKQKWQFCLQPDMGTIVSVSALVEASYNEANQPILRWLLRPLNNRNQTVSPKAHDSSTSPDYPAQVFYKGETIPLEPQTIWQVQSGLVKLTTFLDSGQEVVTGLVGVSAPFGGSLTASPFCEATALVDTRLWRIPLDEFSTSMKLQQRLLPHINKRLKQAELLLAIYGQLRVADRLHSLLQLLKQEVGQPIPGGTRLTIRLTHEELAAICCTTRVTVTRLISQLRQQEKLTVDPDHHFVLQDETTASAKVAVAIEAK